MKKILLILLLLCGIFAVSARADYYADYVRIVENPQSSPYYDYSNRDIYDAVADKIAEVRLAYSKFPRNKTVIWENSAEAEFDSKVGYHNALSLLKIGLMVEYLLNEVYSNHIPNIENPQNYDSFAKAATMVLNMEGLAEWMRAEAEEYMRQAVLLLHKDKNLSPDLLYTHPETNQEVLGRDFLKKADDLERQLSDKIERNLIGSFGNDEEKSRTVMAMAALDYYADELNKLNHKKEKGRSFLPKEKRQKIDRVATEKGYAILNDDLLKK